MQKRHVYDSLQTLLGIEGAAARGLLCNFAPLIKSDRSTFDFRTRNRRPPRDPVNAVLSFLYSMLIKQALISGVAVGFDPYMAFTISPSMDDPHWPSTSPRVPLHNRRFRYAYPLQQLGAEEGDFIRRSGAVALTEVGRKAVIRAFERKLDTLITHPLFKYSISYRRVMEVQAALVGPLPTGRVEKNTPPLLQGDPCATDI